MGNGKWHENKYCKDWLKFSYETLRCIRNESVTCIGWIWFTLNLWGSSEDTQHKNFVHD